MAPESVQLSHHSITRNGRRVAGSGEDLRLFDWTEDFLDGFRNAS